MNNQSRPGTEFEQNIDKIGQNLIKDMVNVIKEQFKKIFKNGKGKTN